MASKAQVAKFIRELAPLAQAEYKKRKKNGSNWVLPSVCIAQAALETGWGTSKLMTKAKAYFGIKWTKGCGYDAYSTKTNEVYDGKKTTITAAFRAYGSVEESVADYYKLICESSIYKKAVNIDNPEKAIEAIKKCGYATDPDYAKTVATIIKQYALTGYDVVEKKEEQPKKTSKVSYPGTMPILPRRGYFAKGDIGEEVKKLQSFLEWFERGVCGSAGCDGKLGNATFNAVKTFQVKVGCKVDGLWGEKTQTQAIAYKK